MCSCRKSSGSSVSAGVLLGMWLERILIIWNTLGHGYLPTLWRVFWPTIVDWGVMAGSVGFFVALFLLFVRVIPSISMFEVRELALEEGGA